MKWFKNFWAEVSVAVVAGLILIGIASIWGEIKVANNERKLAEVGHKKFEAKVLHAVMYMDTDKIEHDGYNYAICNIQKRDSVFKNQIDTINSVLASNRATLITINKLLSN